MYNLFYQATLPISTWCSSSESKWLAAKNKVRLLSFLPFPGYVKWLAMLMIFVAGLFAVWWLARFILKRFFNRILSLRWLIKLEVGAFVLSVLLLSPWGIAAANRGLVAMVPADTGAPADAIVVLGRGPRLQFQRIQAVASLWEAHRAPLIFASGVQDAEDTIERLKSQGIPSDALEGEGCSLTTEENAQFTATALKPKGVQRIVLVTDSPHMLRSLLTFQSLGFQVTPYAAGLPPLNQKQKTWMVLSEYGGLLSYGLQGRFFSRTNENVASMVRAVSATNVSATY
jgi:uncharacterized SAM-binding protein YcdF (DUF218 family)